MILHNKGFGPDKKSYLTVEEQYDLSDAELRAYEDYRDIILSITDANDHEQIVYALNGYVEDGFEEQRYWRLVRTFT